MELFDLHCDTLYRAITEKKTLNEPEFHLSVDRGFKYEPWVQVMAVWIPDELRGNKAASFAQNAIKHLKNELPVYNKINLCEQFDDLKSNVKHNFIIAIEGGAALAGDLKNIENFRKLGVRFITLTWNGTNEIGDGAGVKNPLGITKFGKQAVTEMEKNKIIIDISHASDKLFYDVASIAKAPFVATHSNSRKICRHKRNLTDEQFRIIKDKGGIVGLNFCPYFLKEGSENNNNAAIYDILNHAEYFLSLGGENTVCLGSDFDGTDMPVGINGIESMATLYELFLKQNYNESLVRKIFFGNASSFCQNFDK